MDTKPIYAILPVQENVVKIELETYEIHDPKGIFLNSLVKGFDHISDMKDLFVAMGYIQNIVYMKYKEQALFEYIEEDEPDPKDLADSGDFTCHWNAPGMKLSDFF